MGNYVRKLVSRPNVVVAVYDLRLITSPSLYTPRQRMVMRHLLKPSARRAAAIIVVADIPALREIAADAALCFDTRDESALADVMYWCSRARASP